MFVPFGLVVVPGLSLCLRGELCLVSSVTSARCQGLSWLWVRFILRVEALRQELLCACLRDFNLSLFSFC